MSFATICAAGDSEPLRIRWMIRRDMPAVQQIEAESFEFAWSEGDFIRCLRQRNCIGMVAECENQVVGFMIYELHQKRLHILNFAVARSWRGCGVGRAMICKLTSKLSADRRDHIIVEVRETNLDAQLFFRRLGFRAVAVLRGHYDNSDEDAYQMRYQHRLLASGPIATSASNRIAGLIG